MVESELARSDLGVDRGRRFGHSPTFRSSGRDGSGWADLELAVAAVALVLLGLRQFVTHGLTSGYLLAFLLAPVWYRSIRRTGGAQTLLWLGVAAYVAGVVLARVNAWDHVVSSGNTVSDGALLVGTVAGFGVILWARELMRDRSVGALLGVGMLANAVLGTGRYTDNPWKYAWAIPVGVVVLAIFNRYRRSFWELAALLILAGLSGAFGSRSYMATFGIAACVVLWQLRPGTGLISRGWMRGATALVGVAVGAYYLGTSLLVDGAFGSTIQDKTIGQIETAGSLILGGRPEIAATAALMRYQPWGFGVGVVPNMTDISVAKAGMLEINYMPNNGYVDNFMFGSAFELHSTIGDMWAHYGLVGAALAVAIGIFVARCLILRVVAKSANGLVVFLSIWTFWNLFFSPFYSAAPTLMVALGLCALPLKYGKKFELSASADSGELLDGVRQ